MEGPKGKVPGRDSRADHSHQKCICSNVLILEHARENDVGCDFEGTKIRDYAGLSNQCTNNVAANKKPNGVAQRGEVNVAPGVEEVGMVSNTVAGLS